MEKGKNQHVVTSGTGWGVIGEGNMRKTVLTHNKKAAIDPARQIAKNKKSELIIHNKHGQIIARDSFGNDPYPPKG